MNRKLIIIVVILALVMATLACGGGGGGGGGRCTVDSEGNWHCPEDHPLEQAREAVKAVNEAVVKEAGEAVTTLGQSLGQCNAELKSSKGLPVAGPCK